MCESMCEIYNFKLVYFYSMSVLSLYSLLIFIKQHKYFLGLGYICTKKFRNVYAFVKTAKYA